MRIWFNNKMKRRQSIDNLRKSIVALQDQLGWLDCWKEKMYSPSVLVRKRFHERVETRPWTFPKEIVRAVLEGNTWPLDSKRFELYKEIQKKEELLADLLEKEMAS